MKALTICQPYAELIARGEKPIENRTYPIRYRGPLAIHAGKSRDWLSHDDLTEYPDLIFGAIVATATLYDCVQVANLPRALVGHDHANGPWCWLLKDIVRLASPILMSGKQGLWDVELLAGDGRRP